MLGGILQDVSDFEGIAGNREHTVLVESRRDPLPKLLHFDANICYNKPSACCFTLCSLCHIEVHFAAYSAMSIAQIPVPVPRSNIRGPRS
jgi:hypothetical protein